MKGLATIRPYLIAVGFFIGIIVFLYYDVNKILGAIILFIFTVYNLLILLRFKKKESGMNQFTSYINESISDNLYNMAIPVVMVKDTGEIIWHNNNFVKFTKLTEIKGQNIVNIIRGINLENLFKDINSSHQRLKVENTLYDISSSKIVYDNEEFRLIYFNDLSEVLSLVNSKDSLKEGIMLIEVDNLTEALDTTDEENKPLVVAEVERFINSYATKIRAMVKRYDNNKYVLSVQEKFIQEEVEKKFPILDEISKINKGNKLELTLSIGVGVGGISPYENNAFATTAKELALGRGGDQAVVKNNENIKFFGGNTKEIEKRTKVRARVVSHALKELIYESSKVYIIGHSNPDMDCFGSAVALSSIVKQLGKSCKIILNNDINAIDYFLNILKKDEKYSDRFISLEKAHEELDDKTLMIIVDVHNKSYVSDFNIVEKAKRKIIIDHHRRSADIIEGTMLNYIEVYASSTSEMITELIQYIMDKPEISKIEAEGLLAGIFMDTKGFSFKTGVRTFEAASFLRNKGADTIEVKKMFTDNLDDYLKIAETIKSAKVENNTAIAISPNDVDSVLVAKAADELLNISGIFACFVLANINGDIYISGRSVGDINVQVVLEVLGGGGHMNIAGAKLSNTTIDEAVRLLKDAMSKNLRVGDLK